MCPNTLVHNYITVVKVRHPVRLVALVFPLETSVIFGNTVTENKGAEEVRKPPFC